jgi:exopolysaccharide biosynthesis polyprenyl glycosylphosphotransferase
MVKRHIGWLFVMLKVVADALLIAISFNLAWRLRYDLGIGGAVSLANFVPLDLYAWLRASLVGGVLLVLAAAGNYRPQRGRRFMAEAVQLVQAILAAFGLLVIALFVMRVSVSSRLMLGYTAFTIIVLLLASRAATRGIKQIFWRRGIGVVRVMVVGDGLSARDIMRDLLQGQKSGRKLWGCLTLDQERSGSAILVDADRPMIVPVLGRVHDLDTVLVAHNIRQVVIALPESAGEAINTAVRTCMDRHVDFRLVPELYGIAAKQVAVDHGFSRPVLVVNDSRFSGRGPTAKRWLDIVLSIVVLVPFGLLAMLVIAVLIKLDSPGPVLFRQRRLTRDGSVFWVYKFRSMRVNAEAELARLKAISDVKGPIFKMRHDPRLTRVGRWLRRTSLDELPQIINILLGEMSWVGPRPPLPDELEHYDEWHRRRLGTTTGLTGLWQVSGRSLLSFEEMVKLDLYYIENWSIWLDLRILLKTIPCVLTAKGAY